MKDKAIGFNCINFILLNNVKTYIVNNKVIRNFLHSVELLDLKCQCFFFS